jgi:hypothetical protein
VRRGDTVSPDDLEEGDRVVMHWSPYRWAQESDGYENPVVATVVDAPRHASGMRNVRLRLEDSGAMGRTVSHKVDLGYIVGKSSSPDTPPSTDVGRFRRYERAEPTQEQKRGMMRERRREATRGGARYGGSGGDDDFMFDNGGGWL